MYKSIFKIMVLIIGILLANLITIWIDNYTLTYKWNFPPYVFTWIGMGVVVLIYYPLFTHIDKWATKFGDKFMKAGKKFIGRKIGAVLAFLIVLFVLYYFYGKEWFHINVIKQLYNAIIK